MFECEICDKRFDLKREFKEHSDLKHKKPFQCEFCGKTFYSVFWLRDHFKKNHQKSDSNQEEEMVDTISISSDESSSECDIKPEHLRLNQNFDLEGSNFQHEDTINITSDESSNECDIDLERLRSNQIFKDSHRIDVGNLVVGNPPNSDIIENQVKEPRDKSIFKCNLCNKQFALKSSLQIHERNHDNIKVFKCDLCDKQFRLSSSLELHKKSHAKELLVI